jgi:hypothetical protein
MTKTAKRKRGSPAARAAAPAGKPKPDPVTAAINQHRTALLARWAAFAAYKDLAGDDPGYNRAKARSEAAFDREHEALKALVACEPTTINGLLALLAYVGESEDGPHYEPDHTETIIVGAFQSEKGTDNEWTRRIGRVAKHLLDAEPIRREP